MIGGTAVIGRTALALALATGLGGTAAFAQEAIPEDYPIDSERFRPAIDPYGYAVTESATALEHLQVGVGIWGSYSEDSAVLAIRGERLIGPAPRFPDAMLDQKTVVDFQLGLGLGKVFAITAEGPVVVWQTGFEPAAERSPVATTDPLPSGLGDLRVTPKIVLVDLSEGSPIGLALLATGTIPTGNTRSLIGEGGFTFSPMVSFEAANGPVRSGEYLARGAVNLGARVKETDIFRDVAFGPEFVYRAALSARPIPEFEIGSDLQGSVAGLKTAQVPLEILPWVRFHGAEVATFTFGAGFGLAPGLGSPDYRIMGGATIAPRFDPLSLDRDRDGIPNRYDECINQPEDKDGFQDEDGCPDPDNDGDGILDTVDSCRDLPEDFDNFEDVDGCPDLDNDRDNVMDATDRCPDIPEDPDGFQDLDGCPDPDNDGDGIPDERDQCPNAAENFNGVQDEDGCPEDWVDADGDGIHDAVDACPTEPEDFDNFQDEDGCPDLDNDGDGIPDTQDQCPFDPETINNYLDDDGCPDEAPARVSVGKEKITITEKIFFQYNKAVIQKISHELLNEVARVVNDTPRVQLIQVEGHTDSDGSDTYNLKLSTARAQSVVDYLVKNGVDGSRLVAKGFGESLPIDTNDTAKGKAKNRRVEFTILEQE